MTIVTETTINISTMYSIIGIDFGTSSTAVKVRNYSEKGAEDCKTIMFNGQLMVPTLIFKTESGVTKFGWDAQFCINRGDKGEALSNFKMHLLDSDKQVETRDNIKAFFSYLYEQYSIQKENLGVYEDVRTWVSYPAKWTSDVRRLMEECASEAGFPNVNGLDEPTAAIRCSLAPRTLELAQKGYLLPGKEYNVFLIDMGAGTTDIAIFTLKAETRQVKIDKIVTYPRFTNDATLLCGGREIDEAFQMYFSNLFSEKFHNNEQATKLLTRVLKNDPNLFKVWKESLSLFLKHGDQEDYVVPSAITNCCEMAEAVFPNDSKDITTISKRDFECFSADHWLRWDKMIKESLVAAQQGIPSIKGAESIDFIIATGGHSQWYSVYDYFFGTSHWNGIIPPDFKKIKSDKSRFLQEGNPQETVAIGLTLDDTVMTVNPVFGNNMWTKIDVEGREGDFVEIISATDPIPCSIEREFEFPINTHYLRVRDFTFAFELAYGNSLSEDTLIQKKSITVSPPDIILRYILQLILSPIELARFLYISATKSYEEAFADIIANNMRDFKLKIKTSYTISMDGTIEVLCKYQIDDSDEACFTFKL